MDDADNLAHFPVGAGAALHCQRFAADLQGVLRPTVGGSLFTEDAQMHTWGVNLSGGTEF